MIRLRSLPRPLGPLLLALAVLLPLYVYGRAMGVLTAETVALYMLLLALAFHYWGGGVLRQLANDAAPDSVDEDIRNGTRTALLAHAFSAADEAGRTHLLRLRESARSDPQAHAALRRALWDPAVLAGYAAQLRLLRQHACALLDQLASPSPHRELLHALVHATARQATPDAR